jgi:hypothetical protein
MADKKILPRGLDSLDRREFHTSSFEAFGFHATTGNPK